MAMVCNRHIPTLRNDLLDTTLSAVREERQRDPATSSLAAHYEYNPYGNLINSTGPYKDANPFRFSTKWFDVETGLGYWGYRYYSPRLGRWMSRDPINEPGAALIRHEPEVATLPPLDLGGTIDLEANLQRFVGNDPSNIVDALGLWGRETHWGDPDQQRVRGTYDIAIDIGFSDRCARVLADWNQGVDDVTPAFLYPYYHFEPGRFAIAVDRWRTGVDKLRRANVYWSPWIWDVSVYDGLAHIGEALHGYQESFAHIATHHADTPLRHVTGPNSGRYTVPTRFYRAGDSLANRPDDPDLFPDDYNSTVADTDIRLRQIWRIRSVQCHCR